MKQLLDIDPWTKTETWHHYDPLTDETTIETRQETSTFLERNKQTQKIDGYSKKGIKESWWHVASIPNGVIEKWMVEEGLNALDRNHWPRVKRKLNDPEWRYLRTGLGRV